MRVGGASAGMVAKLEACRMARRGGVASVIIADGRRGADLDVLSGTLIEPSGQESES